MAMRKRQTMDRITTETQRPAPGPKAAVRVGAAATTVGCAVHTTGRARPHQATGTLKGKARIIR